MKTLALILSLIFVPLCLAEEVVLDLTDVRLNAKEAEGVVDGIFEIITELNLTTQAVNGAVTKAPDQASYPHGSEVVLTATPNAGYHFLNWTGDVSVADNPLTLVMDSDKSVTANFEIDVTMTAGRASGYPNDTGVPVSITISDIGEREIIAMDITLLYDEAKLEATAVEKGAVTSDWAIAANTNVAGQVKIALYHTTHLTSGGEVAQILFNVK